MLLRRCFFFSNKHTINLLPLSSQIPISVVSPRQPQTSSPFPLQPLFFPFPLSPFPSPPSSSPFWRKSFLIRFSSCLTFLLHLCSFFLLVCTEYNIFLVFFFLFHLSYLFSSFFPYSSPKTLVCLFIFSRLSSLLYIFFLLYYLFSFFFIISFLSSLLSLFFLIYYLFSFFFIISFMKPLPQSFSLEIPSLP